MNFATKAPDETELREIHEVVVEGTIVFLDSNQPLGVKTLRRVRKEVGDTMMRMICITCVRHDDASRRNFLHLRSKFLKLLLGAEDFSEFLVLFRPALRHLSPH